MSEDFLFTRIKGANSDYAYAPQVQQVVQNAAFKLTEPSLVKLATRVAAEQMVAADRWRQLESSLRELIGTQYPSEAAMSEILKRLIRTHLGEAMQDHPILYVMLEHAEKTPPADLFLQIFLCPYGQPSRIDQVQDGTASFCEGTNAQCPHGRESVGHAVVLLDRTDGIKLIAGANNELVVGQDGLIKLSPTRQAEVHAPLTVKGATEIENSLTVYEQAVFSKTLTVSDQAVFKGSLVVDGASELKHTVMVQGQTELKSSLTVTGPAVFQSSLTVTGPTHLQRLITQGQTEINGSLTVRQQNVLLQVAANGIVLSANGATIAIDSNGGITCTPRNQGKVRIEGDLDVVGNITFLVQTTPERKSVDLRAAYIATTTTPKT